LINRSSLERGAPSSDDRLLPLISRTNYNLAILTRWEREPCEAFPRRQARWPGRGANLNYVLTRMLNLLRVPRITSRILRLSSLGYHFSLSWSAQPWWDIFGELWSPISDTLSLLNISRINVRHNSMSVIGRLVRRYQFGFIFRFSRGERASVYYYCFAFMAAEWADSDRFRCGNSMGACMRERESDSRERLGRLYKCTCMRMCRECTVKKPDFPARRFLQAAHTCFQFLSR